jgi:hypothetical protein
MVKAERACVHCAVQPRQVKENVGASDEAGVAREQERSEEIIRQAK